MTAQTEHASVKRVRTELESHGVATEIRHLSDTARTAVDAANVLEVEVGQIASSIVFKIDTEQGVRPLLVVTSGRHRVDTALVATALGVPKLGRADADFVRLWSGFAIGGVSPVGWLHDGEVFQPQTIVDTALSDYKVVWGACGHTHVVCSLDFESLVKITAGTALAVAAD
ncbi:MAG: YbaK/EbsC family protein [Candidatus Nanopelagicales bacterium]